MPSNKMRAFIAHNPNLTTQQIEEERQKHIHHADLSLTERGAMCGWSTPEDFPNQDRLF